MNNAYNNPFMDMFKTQMNMCSPGNWNKTLEMAQNYDFAKSFNPEYWVSMSSNFMKNAPWMTKQAHHLHDHASHMDSYAEIHKMSLESAQAMLRRQAEIIQKHSTDIYTLMQNMVSSPNPEAAMSLQNEYVQMAFETLMADFKELMEMYSKANLETFEVASKKVSEHVNKLNKASCHANACHAQHNDEQHEHHEADSHEHRSKKSANKK